jgi:hypothetical protein
MSGDVGALAAIPSAGEISGAIDMEVAGKRVKQFFGTELSAVKDQDEVPLAAKYSSSHVLADSCPCRADQR